MLKKTIKFDDLDGNPVERDYYFNLSESELAEMAFSADSMENRLTRIVASQDGEAIMHEFRSIIRKAIGRRSDDNLSFIKTDEIADAFMGSNAFDVLFFELLTDMDKSTAFVNALVPTKMQENIKKRLAATGLRKADGSQDEDNRPAWEKENRKPTKAELQTMTPQQMQEAFAKQLGV